MSRLWKSSIVIVALVVGVAIVALVVIQPWGSRSGGVASATPRPTRWPTPTVIIPTATPSPIYGSQEVIDLVGSSLTREDHPPNMPWRQCMGALWHPENRTWSVVCFFAASKEALDLSSDLPFGGVEKWFIFDDQTGRLRR